MIYLVALSGQHLLFGLSSDVKATSSPANSIFMEMDTGIVYKLQSSIWTALSSGPVPVGTNPAQLATTSTTTVAATAAAPNASYRTILETSGSHIAGKVAGTYLFGLGDPLAISGTGTLYPLQLINLVAADYPTVNGLTSRLRLRVTLSVNAVAPTGNFTVGLYPVTSSSGGAGLKTYTAGALVSGSAIATLTAPGANTITNGVGSDFVLPSDGVYCIGVVTTATVAVSSLVHINAFLQMRNT